MQGSASNLWAGYLLERTQSYVLWCETFNSGSLPRIDVSLWSVVSDPTLKCCSGFNASELFLIHSSQPSQEHTPALPFAKCGLCLPSALDHLRVLIPDPPLSVTSNSEHSKSSRTFDNYLTLKRWCDICHLFLLKSRSLNTSITCVLLHTCLSCTSALWTSTVKNFMSLTLQVVKKPTSPGMVPQISRLHSRHFPLVINIL